MNRRFSCIHFIREIRSELGGVVTAVIDLSQSMAERGHRITIVTCDAQDVPAAWSSGEGNWPSVIEVPTSSFSKLLLSRQGVKTFAELLPSVDVAHLHTPWDLCNFQLMPHLKRHRKPYLVTAHGMLDHYSMGKKSLKKRTFLALGGRRLFRNATTLHFTAQAEMEQALHYVPGADRALVQCYALDLSSYNPLPGPEPALSAFPQIKRDARKVLFLSRIHPKKGVDLLLRAGAIMKERGHAVQLLIAGPTEERYLAELKRLTAALKIEEMVEFLGMVRGVEKRSLYEASDVFVLPTHQENFGLVLAEAMACGTAVVTTRGTDIWHELQQAGARIVDLTPEDIAAGIWEVISDPENCRRIGQQGCDFVYQWLDRDCVSTAYEKMYYDAVSRGLPPFEPAAAPTLSTVSSQ
jgi:glycosyltransferase involved in cell wall biosynthesis